MNMKPILFFSSDLVLDLFDSLTQCISSFVRKQIIFHTLDSISKIIDSLCSNIPGIIYEYVNFNVPDNAVQAFRTLVPHLSYDKLKSFNNVFKLIRNSPKMNNIQGVDFHVINNYHQIQARNAPSYDISSSYFLTSIYSSGFVDNYLYDLNSNRKGPVNGSFSIRFNEVYESSCSICNSIYDKSLSSLNCSCSPNDFTSPGYLQLKIIQKNKNDDDNSNTNSSSVPGYQIAIIILSVILFCIVVAFVCLIVYKKKNRFAKLKLLNL